MGYGGKNQQNKLVAFSPKRKNGVSLPSSPYKLQANGFLLMLLKRLIVDILLFIAVVTLPWWLSLPCALVLSFYFKRYYEVILSGFVFDLLYGAPLPMFFSFSFLFTLVMAALFFVIEFLKPFLKFYSYR